MREYQLDKKEKVWKVKNADMAFLRKKKKKEQLFKKRIPCINLTILEPILCIVQFNTDALPIKNLKAVWFSTRRACYKE